MNQKKRDFEVFAQPGFLLALALLLLNDWYLKAHFASWLTGKLSDFAGLYVFAQFLAVCLGARIVWTAVATAVLFVAWKSPLATPLIDFVNHYSVVKIHRTIDYTDLVAIAVLPLAVRFYDARTAWAWRFIRYPAAALALLAIMGTSTLQPFYKVRMDLREIPGRQGDVGTSFADVDRLLAARGVQCKTCYEGSLYREYFDPSEEIRIQLNYDNVDRKLFVSVHSIYPKNSSIRRVDELQAALLEVLSARFDNITVARAGSSHEVTSVKTSIWKLRINAPTVGFPLTCGGNGRNHPDIAKAIAIINRALDVPAAMVFPYSSCGANNDRCSVNFCREITFGRVAGPDRYDKSIRASTRGYFDFEGTTLYVELIERGDGQGQGQGASFMGELEKQLRTSLSSDIAITMTVTKSGAAAAR